MFIAQFQSSNFLFEGVGGSEHEARSVLRRVLRQHCKNTGARLDEFFVSDEIYVRELNEGYGFIDGGRVCEF